MDVVVRMELGRGNSMQRILNKEWSWEAEKAGQV